MIVNTMVQDTTKTCVKKEGLYLSINYHLLDQYKYRGPARHQKIELNTAKYSTLFVTLL